VRILIPIVMMTLLICWVLTPGRFEEVTYLPAGSGAMYERACAAGNDAPLAAPATTMPTTYPSSRHAHQPLPR